MKAIAIFCSDIHLCHKAPVFRSDEPDWYEAMRRPIRELRALAKKLDVPVICAGDIFDRWNVPPELINFALQELPDIYAVPGQHDLPNHSYEDIERSAYWTLVEAGVIKHLEHGTPVRYARDLELYGFPYGFTPEPCFSESSAFKVAVIHQYCWIGKYKYPTAPDECNLRNYKLGGYDAVAIGDNHMSWVENNVCNCGGLMRRTSADLDRKPMVGVLMDDGSIKKHLIDTSDDIYSIDSDNKIEETGRIDLGEFTDGLLGLRDSQDLDFAEVLKRYCKKNKVRAVVSKLIREAVEQEL